MASAYKLQIVHISTGKVVEWAPGLQAEVELVDNLCARVKAKGVSRRSEAHIIDDVRTAFEELIYDLKEQV